MKSFLKFFEAVEFFLALFQAHKFFSNLKDALRTLHTSDRHVPIT